MSSIFVNVVFTLQKWNLNNTKFLNIYNSIERFCRCPVNDYDN